MEVVTQELVFLAPVKFIKLSKLRKEATDGSGETVL